MGGCRGKMFGFAKRLFQNKRSDASDQDSSASTPENAATFTTWSVINGTEWIGLVVVDEDGWQALPHKSPDTPFDSSEAAIVGFGQLTEIDPTLKQLANLSCDQIAERSSPNDPWTISYRDRNAEQ